MYAGVLMITMSLTIGPPDSSPHWLTDYAFAQRRAVVEGRPLAVFFGAGDKGFDDVCRDGALSPRARQLLSQKYHCIYLDIGQPSNQRLVGAFAITAGKGVVFSDRTGNLQTFHRDGDLTDAELVSQLQRHAELPSASLEPYFDVTDGNFSAEVLHSKQPILVDFHADWCGPCQRMGPVVVELGHEFRGRARVAKLNTDHHRALASRYGVSTIPAFLIFQDGQVVDRVVGATSRDNLAARLRKVCE